MLRLKPLKITPPSITKKNYLHCKLTSQPAFPSSKNFQRSLLIKKHQQAFDEFLQNERLERKIFLEEDEDDLEQDSEVDQWLFGTADSRDRLRKYEKMKLLPEKLRQEARDLLDRMDSFMGAPPVEQRLDRTITMKHLLNVGRHITITASGRVQSFSALVVGGNGQGTGGIGYGKAVTVQQATEKAWKDLQKNLVSIYRHEDRTVPHPIKVKVGSVRLVLNPRKKGAGMVGNPLLIQVSECFGLDDIMIKVIGQKNSKRMLQAYLYALTERIEPPQEKARRLGKKFVDLTKVWKPQRPFALRDEPEVPDSYMQDVSRLSSTRKEEVNDETEEEQLADEAHLLNLENTEMLDRLRMDDLQESFDGIKSTNAEAANTEATTSK